VKIWFEALTGKQALLFHYMAEFYEQQGHQTLFTTRRSGYTDLNLKRLNRDYFSIGYYGGASLKGKLIAGSKRIIELAELIEHEQPDILVSFSSPDATRTAFGLDIPIILLNDTPHAEAVARLTISLSRALVYPSSINEKEFGQYGVTKFIPYKGVDEALWIKSFEDDLTVLDNLELKSDEYIVLRCEESKSAYFRKLFPEFDPGGTIVEDIVYKFREMRSDLDIVAFPRYPEQEQILQRLGVVVPDRSVDTLTLLHHAKVAMTGGGTMGREAAMLGTPTIYTFPWKLAVSEFIADMGFPLYHFPDHPNAPAKIVELLDQDRMSEQTRHKLLEVIETPIDGFKRALELIKEEIV